MSPTREEAEASRKMMQTLADRNDRLDRELQELQLGVQTLLSEVLCRIGHGAESGGHLDYVAQRLRKLLGWKAGPLPRLGMNEGRPQGRKEVAPMKKTKKTKTAKPAKASKKVEKKSKKTKTAKPAKSSKKSKSSSEEE